MKLAQTQIQQIDKSLLDTLIEEIAEAYVENIGKDTMLDLMPVLENAPVRYNNSFRFNGMEWIGSHLVTKLREIAEEE